MLYQSILEKINPNINNKESFGLKADTSSVNPGETTLIKIPKFSENVVIIPGSVNLLFNLNVVGHANNTVVNNFGRNLVNKLKVIINGNILQDTQRYDIFSNLS